MYDLCYQIEQAWQEPFDGARDRFFGWFPVIKLPIIEKLASITKVESVTHKDALVDIVSKFDDVESVMLELLICSNRNDVASECSDLRKFIRDEFFPEDYPHLDHFQVVDKMVKILFGLRSVVVLKRKLRLLTDALAKFFKKYDAVCLVFYRLGFDMIRMRDPLKLDGAFTRDPLNIPVRSKDKRILELRHLVAKAKEGTSLLHEFNLNGSESHSCLYKLREQIGDALKSPATAPTPALFELSLFESTKSAMRNGFNPVICFKDCPSNWPIFRLLANASPNTNCPTSELERAYVGRNFTDENKVKTPVIKRISIIRQKLKGVRLGIKCSTEEGCRLIELP